MKVKRRQLEHQRRLLERARSGLEHALAPFKPAHAKAEAEQTLADIKAFLESNRD